MSCDRSPEAWRPTHLHPGYEVSSHGQVRPVRPRYADRQLLTPVLNSRGYLKVSLGRRAQAYVHQLVAVAFHGPCPAGHVVDHVDWNRRHNCLRNLRWLHEDRNRVRWAGRTADGRNVWEDPDTAELAALDCSHEPLTPAQEAALLEDLRLAGWFEVSA